MSSLERSSGLSPSVGGTHTVWGVGGEREGGVGVEGEVERKGICTV